MAKLRRHLGLGRSAVAGSLYGIGDLCEESSDVRVEVVWCGLLVLSDIVARHGSQELGKTGRVERSDDVGDVGLAGWWLGEWIRRSWVEWWHVAVETESWRGWLDGLGLCLFGVVDKQGGRCWVEISVFYWCQPCP
jgi:hypothetical protein